MKITFTDHHDAESNADIIRAIAEANTQRPRADRGVQLVLISRPFGLPFNLEGLDDELRLLGVVEDPRHGVLPARAALSDVRSITIEGL